MDTRLLAYWEKVADRARRERMKEMMYSVRVGFNADKDDFARITHELTDETPKEVRQQEEWEFLKLVGGSKNGL
ncbi:MAG: hypothetical protein WC551_09060 [Patescibacteria group bacterium]